jgi:hypothetical protein
MDTKLMKSPSGICQQLKTNFLVSDFSLPVQDFKGSGCIQIGQADEVANNKTH